MSTINHKLKLRSKRLLSTYIAILLLVFNSSLASYAVEPEDPIELLFQDIYEAWNKHDSEKLFRHYSKNFSTGDGIKKSEYKELTEALWQAYPDIKIENQKRTIRSQDQYATISGIDFFYGKSKDENKDLKEKGVLNAISQGQIFLQKFGSEWQVVSDRIQFELVTVYYGNAKQYLDEHNIYFSSPEQVTAGKHYSAVLYFILPENIKATATINKELIEKPAESPPEESFQVIKDHKLERLFDANESNHNELVSATIIISKGIIQPKLDGILYISKRVNVAPKVQPSSKNEVVDSSYADSNKVKAKENEEAKTKKDIEN